MPSTLKRSKPSVIEIAKAIAQNRTPPPKEAVQEIMNELISKKGENLPQWGAYAEILLEHNLLVEDVTPQILANAILVNRAAKVVPIASMPENTEFVTPPGGEIQEGLFVCMSGGDAKVLLDGKTAYWSAYAPVLYKQALSPSDESQVPTYFKLNGLMQAFQEAVELRKQQVKLNVKAEKVLNEVFSAAPKPTPKRAPDEPPPGKDKYGAKIGSIPNQINRVMVEVGEEGMDLEQIALKSNLPASRVLEHLKWHRKERGTFEEVSKGKWRVAPGK